MSFFAAFFVPVAALALASVAGTPAVANGCDVPSRVLAAQESGNDDRVAAFRWPSGALFNHFVGEGLVPLRDPWGLALGPDNAVYVASRFTNAIHRFNAFTGEVLDGGEPFIAAGVGGLSQPIDLVFDHQGRLLVASYDTHRVLRFTADGLYDGDPYATASVGLDRPTSLVIAPDGGILVASAELDVIHRFEPDGTPFGVDGILVPAGTGPNRPRGMTIGPDGRVYVAGESDDRVYRYDPADGTSPDGGEAWLEPGPEGLNGPSDIVFPGDGTMLVSSNVGDARILEYEATQGFFLGVYRDVAANVYAMAFVESADDCASDLTGDGLVGIQDLIQLLTDWGPCS